MIVWNFSFLRNRDSFKDWSDEKFESVKLEYKRFIEILCSDTESTFGMAGEVDTFWHEHILHTRDYIAFCNKHGEKYIHHRPENPNDTDCSKKQENYQNTLRELTSRFGSVNHDVWPELGVMSDCSRCGGNCSSCRG